MDVGKKYTQTTFPKELRQCGCGCSGFRTMVTPDQDLIVYQQPLHDVCGTKTADNEKKTVVSAIVIQNNYGNDVSVQTDVFLPEFELNKISCPRCRHLIGRAKALLKNVPVAKNNNMRCVCEICNLKRLATVPCLHCLNVMKKLKLSVYAELRGVDLLKQPDSPFLKTAFERIKIEKLTRAFRAYSDIHLTDTVERISKNIQPLERPKSALDLDNIKEKKVRISMQADKISVSPKIYEWIDLDYQNKIIREPLHLILKPVSEQAIDHKKKTSYSSRAEALKLKHESLLGFGTTGIMRRYHSEESLKSISAAEKNTFTFFFPRIIKEGKTLYKTSAELIMDTQKRFQAEIEEKIRKQEEKQKIIMGKKQETIKEKGEIKERETKSLMDEKVRKIKKYKNFSDEKGGERRISEDDLKDKNKIVKKKGKEDLIKHKLEKKVTETKAGLGKEKEKMLKGVKGKDGDDITKEEGKGVKMKGVKGEVIKGKDKDDITKENGKVFKGKSIKVKDEDDITKEKEKGVIEKSVKGKAEDNITKEKGKGVKGKDDDDITEEKGTGVKGKGVKGQGVKVNDVDNITKEKGKGVKGKDEDDITKEKGTGVKGKGVKGKAEDDITKEKGKGVKGNDVDNITKEKGKGVKGKDEDDITKEKRKGVKGKDEDDITKGKGKDVTGKGVKGKDEEDFTKEKLEKKIKETKLGQDVEKEKLLEKREKMDEEKGEKLSEEKKKANTKDQTGKIKDEKTAAPKQKKSVEEVEKTKEKMFTGPKLKTSVKEFIKTTDKNKSEVEKDDKYTTTSQTDFAKQILSEQMNRIEGKSEKDIMKKGGEKDIIKKRGEKDITKKSGEKDVIKKGGKKKFKEGADEINQDVIKKDGDKHKLIDGPISITQDEINLVNKVLEKHEKMISHGKKMKTAQEEKLKSIKEKAANTITKQTRSHLPLESAEFIRGVGGLTDIKNKHEKPKFGEKPALKVSMDKIEIQISGDDLILRLAKTRRQKPERINIIETLPPLPLAPYKPKKVISAVSNEQTDLSDTDSLLQKLTIESKETVCGKPEIVCGTQIMFVKDVLPPEPEPKSEPVFFHSEYKGDKLNQAIGSASQPENIKETTVGILSYALSNRKFIDNGWTVLPTEKIVRKVNIYRMHPAYPEFDWFEHNKKKGTLEYSSGEKLAEIDGNGRGRWYYKNGRLALDYYDCEESNAHQRYVIYSSGEPDERGRSTPITVLGMFDYSGNGVVFDHAGKIRLKYNQNEGVVLDRSKGPVCHWKWHTLNDPPELQQVMIDSQLDYKDPEIFAYADDSQPQPQDETILAVEYDNYMKRNKKEKKKEFKPHQINMKTMKMNDQFTLRILDQNRIYLLFRDGATAMKCNLGLKIDHDEIVDTTYCELGEVAVSAIEKIPAITDSIASLQKCLKDAQRRNQVRTARELIKRPLAPVYSVDRMTSAATRPLRRPLQTEDFTQSRTPPANNLYYNTRLI